MPYTFGGTTNDDILFPVLPQAHGATNTACLVMGWWRPTTLTATRGLWSLGNVCGCEIDSTTSQLRLRTDNTTDGQWTVATANPAITVDTWHFLAFLGSFNNTNGAAWRVWQATQDTPVTEATVTVAVARSGNFTGNTNFYVGNKGTDVLAFQGDIGPVAGFFTAATASASDHPLAVSSYGTAFTQTQADQVRDLWVIPAYSGDWNWNLRGGFSTECFRYWSGEAGAQVQTINLNAGTINLDAAPAAINGATVAATQAPRPMLTGNPRVNPFVGTRRPL